MQFNIDNNGTVTGRIENKDFSKGIFKNADGSRKIRMTLAVRDTFTRNGVPSKQDIPVEAFLPASRVKVKDGVESYGIYSTLRTGDMVTVAYHLESNNYVDRNGQPVYGGLVLRIDDIRHRESKAVSEARQHVEPRSEWSAADRGNETPSEWNSESGGQSTHDECQSANNAQGI